VTIWFWANGKRSDKYYFQTHVRVYRAEQLTVLPDSVAPAGGATRPWRVSAALTGRDHVRAARLTTSEGAPGGRRGAALLPSAPALYLAASTPRSSLMSTDPCCCDDPKCCCACGCEAGPCCGKCCCD
jgi:hypothetical protein